MHVLHQVKSQISHARRRSTLCRGSRNVGNGFVKKTFVWPACLNKMYTSQRKGRFVPLPHSVNSGRHTYDTALLSSCDRVIVWSCGRVAVVMEKKRNSRLPQKHSFACTFTPSIKIDTFLWNTLARSFGAKLALQETAIRLRLRTLD